MNLKSRFSQFNNDNNSHKFKTNLSKLKKIIYIDDQVDILIFADYALTEIGNYQTMMCEIGAEALNKIQEFEPDLILLDVMMPELDGPQTLSLIREIGPLKGTPAIFITAKIFPNEIAELKSSNKGVLGVIPKPFDPITISATIQSMWDSLFFEDNNKRVGSQK